MPIARMPAARLQWVMMASGIAVAKMRTQSARARAGVPEEVLPRGGLASRGHEPGDDDGGAVGRDDGYARRAQCHRRAAKSPRRARARIAERGAKPLRP